MKLIDPRGGTIDTEQAKKELKEPLLTQDQSVYLAELLSRFEGLRLKPYRDTVGKLTIGFGRNLEDKGISQLEAEFLLYQDIEQSIESILNKCPWAIELLNLDNFGKFAVLVSLRFQMGEKGFLGFKKFLKAAKERDWKEAAKELLDSDAARKYPKRFSTLESMILS